MEPTKAALKRQITDLGDKLAQATVLVQTQDGEIGRLTTLNDKLFEVIYKMVAKNNGE